LLERERVSDRRINVLRVGVKKKKGDRTGFRVPPLDVGFVVKQTANFQPTDDSDCAGEAPAQTHTEFVRAGELGFLPPLLVDGRVSRVACLKKGLDKSYGCRGGDVESECGEDKRGCEAASTYLLRGNFDEPSDFLESEHDMTLVREITVILSDFAFLGVEARWA
jgi:hypothetical protein